MTRARQLLFAIAFIAGASCDRGRPEQSVPVAPPASPRSRIELLEAMHDVQAGVAASAERVPEAPPQETELAWLADRSLPLAERVNGGLALIADVKAVMKAVMARDMRRGVETLENYRWTAATIAVFARLSDVLMGEVVPTLDPNDPTYATRMDGLQTMTSGAREMLTGSTLILAGRRGEAEGRRHLARTWARHIGSYTALWTADQCAQHASAVSSLLRDEKDATVMRSLDEVVVALGTCKPAK